MGLPHADCFAAAFRNSVLPADGGLHDERCKVNFGQGLSGSSYWTVNGGKGPTVPPDTEKQCIVARHFALLV
jgi:hypothetical protein